jgi:hypothetical protein
MIPKIIHYFWVGPEPLPAAASQLIEGWEKVMPDFEFRYWNNTNIPQNIAYVNRALEQKQYANAVDFLRLYVLYHYGGIYLDTDIEVIKSFVPLLEDNFFIGRQPELAEQITVNNAVIGSRAQAPFLLDCMFYHLSYFTGSETPNWSGPMLVTSRLKAAIARSPGNHGLTIYPESYFYPYGWFEQFTPACVKPETYAVHHWEKTWGESPTNSQETVLVQLKRIARMVNYLTMGRKAMEWVKLIEPILQLAANIGVCTLSIETVIPTSKTIKKRWEKKRELAVSDRQLKVLTLNAASINSIDSSWAQNMLCFKTDGTTDFTDIDAIKSRAAAYNWLFFDYHHSLGRDINEAIEDDRLLVFVPADWFYLELIP